MIDISLSENTYQEYSRILIDPSDQNIGSNLNETFEFAQSAKLRLVLDSSIETLPNYSSDCVWSTRHEKSPLTDIKIKLLAMQNQTKNNHNGDLLISISKFKIKFSTFK